MAGGPLTPEPATDTSRRRSVDDTAQVARLRWGAIWAGVLIALTAFLLLELLVFGISLVSAADRPGNSRDEDWVSGIIGLIAFFIGGYVASKASAAEDVSAARDARAGLLDGHLVWALGSVLILTLSALGVGQIFGALRRGRPVVCPGGSEHHHRAKPDRGYHQEFGGGGVLHLAAVGACVRDRGLARRQDRSYRCWQSQYRQRGLLG